jgi:16S rRNA (guanine1516-N2)-methyltransferase
MNPRCAVVPAPAGRADRARLTAERLQLPLLMRLEQVAAPVALVVSDTEAWLQQTGPGAAGPVRVDFSDPGMQYRRKGGQNELLGRAVGVKAARHPAVFDATAGLGRDAYVLADLGCDVTLCERSPVLAFLLEEAIAAAGISAQSEVRDAANRMHLTAGDARDQVIEVGQVIYLDPMFPDRRSSAAVRKDLATLQQLHGVEQAEEADAMLEWALQQPASRIVVKRPPKAPRLADMKVSHAITGKAVRFDVLVRPEFSA